MNRQTYNLPQGVKLNLGCGPVQPKGWVNIDGSNRAWFATRLSLLDRLLVTLKILPPTEFNRTTRFCNLFKGIPYADNSVACIYAGELWEHFEYEDAYTLSRECYRALRPNGVLRVCVPDGPTFWGTYLELYQSIQTQPRRSRSAKPLRDHIQMHFDTICTRKIYLGSMGHTHKWEYDEVQLIDMFEKNGFSAVERMPFHHSRIPDVENVERSDFLIVEGVKEK